MIHTPQILERCHWLVLPAGGTANAHRTIGRRRLLVTFHAGYQAQAVKRTSVFLLLEGHVSKSHGTPSKVPRDGEGFIRPLVILPQPVAGSSLARFPFPQLRRPFGFARGFTYLLWRQIRPRIPIPAPGLRSLLLLRMVLKLLRCCCCSKKNHGDDDEKIDLGGGNVHVVTSREDWDQKVADANRDGKIVVANFSATWCGPCRVISPVYAEMSQTYPQLMFLTIDVDELMDFSSSWDIRATPTFFFLKNRQQVDKLVGANKPELEKKVAALAGASA